MQGDKSPTYPYDVSMRNAILKSHIEDISNGGSGVVSYVKTDKGVVYKDVKIKIDVQYKKEPS